MILHSIKIENFRGIRTGQFDFNGRPFVLLTAQNGLGKTTLLDAIEWVLTGNIHRLQDAYDSRSTNPNERQKNSSGIIRNKDSSVSEQISVELTFSENGEVFSIKRSQKQDVLDSKKAKQHFEVIRGNSTQCDKILAKIERKNFYQYHFCDIHKSINMQSCKRKDLVDLFSEFISDYSAESNCAENLNRFIADIEQKISVIQERVSILTEKNKQYNTTIERLSSHSKIISYPLLQIFEGEITADLTSLSATQLQQQLSLLTSCAHYQLAKLLHLLVLNQNRQRLLEKGKELQRLLVSKQNAITEVLQINANGNLDKIVQDVSRELDKCLRVTVTRNKLKENADFIIGFGCSDFSHDFYSQGMKKISDYEFRKKELSGDVDSLTTGNKLLNTLSSLLGLEEDLLAYRTSLSTQNGVVKCPVCGSERFGQIEETQILAEVKRQTTENDVAVSKKKKQLETMKECIEQTYLYLIDRAKKALQAHITSQEEYKQHLETLKQDTEDYFALKRSLQVLYPDISADVWINSSQISELLRHIESELLPQDSIKQVISNFIPFYKAIYEKEPEIEKIEAIYKTENSLSNAAPKILADFQPDCFLVKKQSIQSLLNNQEFTEAAKSLESNNKELENLTDEIKSLTELRIRADFHMQRIKDMIARLKQAEYQSIGPYLQRLYKKLARVNSIEKINIQNDEDGERLSLLDEKGKNIVNILSNGQLSVFMLAYFFAGILSRNNTESCKIYFIDDLTACMDDVNMLAFLDLLKYQMLSDNHPIDQLFFASCDDRVCELLKYKLNGCHIPYAELSNQAFLLRQ